MYFKAVPLALCTLTKLTCCRAEGLNSENSSSLWHVLAWALPEGGNFIPFLSKCMNWFQTTPSRNSCAQIIPYTNTSSYANIHSKTWTGTDLMLKTTPLCTSFLQQVFNTTLWEDSASFCHFLKEFAVRIMHRQLSAPPTEGFSFTLNQWHFGRVKWTETLSINLISCDLTGGKYFGGWSCE